MSRRPLPPLSESDVARFQSKVKKTDGCWLWLAKRTPRGYGEFSIKDRTVRASHVALAIAGIVVPDGMQACHKCDNPPCVRPDHLFIGTQLDNERDKRDKGRTVSGDRHYARREPERLARGVAHGMSKLDDVKVAEIRRLYASDTPSLGRLAARFGVAKTLVANIVKRRIWRHVA